MEEPKHHFYYYWKLAWRYGATMGSLIVNCRIGQTDPAQWLAALDNQPDFPIQEPSQWKKLYLEQHRGASLDLHSLWRKHSQDERKSRTRHAQFLPSLRSTNKMKSFLLAGGGANEEGGWRITEVLGEKTSPGELEDRDRKIPPNRDPQPCLW